MNRVEIHPEIIRYYYQSKKVHTLYLYVRLKTMSDSGGKVHMKMRDIASFLSITPRGLRYNIKHCVAENLISYDKKTHKIYLTGTNKILTNIAFKGSKSKKNFVYIESKHLGTKSDFDLFCFSLLNSMECEKRRNWINKRSKNDPTDQNNEGYRSEWVHLSCVAAGKHTGRSAMTASIKKRLAKSKGLLNFKPCFRLIKGLSPLLAAFYTDERGNYKRLLIKGDKVYERLADIYISGVYVTQKLLKKYYRNKNLWERQTI